jgi:hypothetical protein
MAGTVVLTEEASGRKVTFAFTATAGGAADKTTNKGYTGKVEQVTIIPGAVVPTALWDVAITDGDSVDILFGNGANLSATDTTIVTEGATGTVANDFLTLAVTNAGNGATGTVVVYLGG